MAQIFIGGLIALLVAFGLYTYGQNAPVNATSNWMWASLLDYTPLLALAVGIVVIVGGVYWASQRN